MEAMCRIDTSALSLMWVQTNITLTYLQVAHLLV